MKNLGKSKAGLTGPVADGELELLFAPLARYRLAVIAVSGGPDSMALMYLISRWCRLHAAELERGVLPRIEAVTIDHRLRPEGAREALWVGEQAAALGLNHRSLAWECERPATAIQALAREARYRLLAEVAGRMTPSAVLTAHTEDDQAETLIMRLGRGSGLDGLAAMAPLRPLSPAGGVDLVRPLLGVAKARLCATLDAACVPWLSDPSNDRSEFERVRVRQARDQLAQLGLTSERLALSARRLRRAREAVDGLVRDFCRREVDVNAGVYASLSRAAFATSAEEVQVRVLARLLAAFGGSSLAARLSQVEALVGTLSKGGRVAATLGGCIVSAGERVMRVYREPAVARLASIELVPGASAVWDGRFRVSVARVSVSGEPDLRLVGRPGQITVQPLGSAGYATLLSERQVTRRVPARAAASLPAFWSGGSLLSVPLLGVEARLPDKLQPFGACKTEFLGWEFASS
ncbi:MAG: tRNA lysidine(34) synthetase TilS [Hyphomicrobium sp.]